MKGRLKKSSSIRILMDLLQFAWPHRRLFLFAALLIPLAAGFHLLQPFIVKVTIDNYISRADVVGVALFSLFYLIVFLFEDIADFFQNYFINVGAQRALFDMRGKLFNHALKLPLRYFDRHPTGVIVSRINNDVSTINDLFVNGIVSLVKDLVMLVAIIAMLLHLHFRLALMSLVLMPLLFYIGIGFQKQLRTAYTEIRRLVGKLNGYLAESIAGIEVIKLFQREEKNLAEYNDINRQTMQAALHSIRADAMFFAIIELFGSITLAIIVWYGSSLITGNFANSPAPLSSEGALSFGTLVAFIEYLNRFFVPLREFSGKLSIIQSAVASGERILAILKEREEIDGAKTTANFNPEAPLAVAIQGVSLSYGNGKQVLHRLSLDIHSGENLALVGATGSGKTSLARLLLRLYDFQEGRIVLHQADREREIRDLPLAELRQIVGMVPQDVAVFHGSAAENVAMQPQPLSPERQQRIEAIFTRLKLQHHFQLDDLLGERGYNLSAGERQLLALARILYFNPSLLILDEATSNIDARTETEIQQAMSIVMRERTSLVIAHRLSTIQRADRILVMKQGKIVAAGSHQRLLQQSTLYQTLVREYAGSSLPMANP